MEFRLYDKVNCSVFDLIGKHEPHQTKSLGLLLAKSEKSLKTFLKLIGLSSICYDEYIVDCEPRNVCGKRFDILIYYCPLNMFLCRIIRFLAKDKPPLKR